MADTTEVWFRNPHNYIREIVAVPDARKIIWDRGMLMKKRIDPQAFGNLYFGKNPDWQTLVTGDQGCAQVDFEHGMDKPIAVYPVWVYGEDDLSDLENMIVNPVGMSRAACSTRGPADETPVFGQPHRIILSNLPAASLSQTKSLLRNIREIQEDHEHMGSVIHLHATYAFSLMFSLGLGATDVDARAAAAVGDFVIPPGKRVKAERAHTVQHWVNLLDMHPSQLKVPSNRCIYNIKSALWAGENWTTDLKFKVGKKVDLDPRDPAIRDTTKTVAILGSQQAQPGDKVLCNSCSLQDKCKFYREDAVCTVPGSEVSPLAEYFKSRNADTIIDALGTVLAAQAQRVERGVAQEEDFGEIDPHVSKMINDLFKNGKDLAKLLNPKLGGAGVTVNVGAAIDSGQAQDGKTAIARAVRQIQSETGLALGEITPDLIVSMMARMGSQQAIES